MAKSSKSPKVEDSTTEFGSAAERLIDELRSPDTIRNRCRELLDLGRSGLLTQFRFHENRLGATALYVAETIRRNYPDLVIPIHSRWRHFAVPTYNRWARLVQRLSSSNPEERTRVSIDLVVTSVLLDAGAGSGWRYRDPKTGEIHARSEGLALATFDMFESGGFSMSSHEPWRTHADRLAQMETTVLAAAFQVSRDNPLLGLEGRAALLRKLGVALRENPEVFGYEEPRVGRLYDYLASRSSDGRLSARIILDSLLDGFCSIWPSRFQLYGWNLGDVWHHAGIERDDASNGLIPFHKLSQWMAYSLVEPLETAGIRVTELGALTGLAEYRNGGLLVDLGVLEPMDPHYAEQAYPIDSLLVVEWRALTIACLDLLLPLVRAELGLDETSLTLTQLMQGGTWIAGRRAARERRMDGRPPIRVASDGTVF